MTQEEAIQRLRVMYATATGKGERSLAPVLFGVRYAEQLTAFRTDDLRLIAGEATGYPNYGNEINQGRRMASYVQWKGEEA